MSCIVNAAKFSIVLVLYILICLFVPFDMLVEKLFGSKAKTDILKYLIFRRQGISMRAFETELQRSFPAIKKQIDQLEEAGMVEIRKDSSKWSISLEKGLHYHLKDLFLYILKQDLKGVFGKHPGLVQQYYLGKVFGNDFDMDLVLVYNPQKKSSLVGLKKEITEVFRVFLIEYINVVFLSIDEFDQRYRLADKFVLGLMRKLKPEIT